MPRKMEDITAEYNQQCAILGDAQYKLTLMEADVRAMLRRLKNLNAEAKGAAAAASNEVVAEASDAS